MNIHLKIFQYYPNFVSGGSKILQYIRIFNVIIRSNLRWMTILPFYSDYAAWLTAAYRYVYRNDIRTLLRFTEEEAEVWKQALPFVPARYIRTSDAFSEHWRHPLGVSKLVSFSYITSWAYFFWKVCAFWALGIAPTLAIPGLL